MAEPKQLKTKFTGVTLKSFTRSEKGISMSFSSNLTAELIKSRGWAELGDHEESVRLTGALAAHTITLNGAGTLSSFAVSIEAQSVGDFEGVRREVKGKKSKGFRHVLHFKAKSNAQTGCRDLEKFLLSIPEEKGTIIVMHSPDKPKQGDLEGIEADEEAAQSTLEEND